jgi:CRP-like cAMP-binding protein
MMMQTLSLARPWHFHKDMPPPAARLPSLPSREVEAACELFLARTAPCGPCDELEKNAMMEAVVGLLSLDAHQSFPVEIGTPTRLHLVVEGWAYRARILSSGARQITDILLPGDLFALNEASRPCHDEIRVRGAARVAVLQHDVLVGESFPSMQRRFDWMRAAEVAMLRSRLISLGRRSARERIAHLLAELHQRLMRVGLATDGAFFCPLTQEQVADALGLTSIHVNRVLQRLRREGVVTFSKQLVVISDLARLHDTADFDDLPTYPEPGECHDLLS